MVSGETLCLAGVSHKELSNSLCTLHQQPANIDRVQVRLEHHTNYLVSFFEGLLVLRIVIHSVHFIHGVAVEHLLHGFYPAVTTVVALQKGVDVFPLCLKVAPNFLNIEALGKSLVQRSLELGFFGKVDLNEDAMLAGV